MMLKPYLRFLTDSEIHSLMLAGFASVSGKYIFNMNFNYQKMINLKKGQLTRDFDGTYITWFCKLQNLCLHLFTANYVQNESS